MQTTDLPIPSPCHADWDAMRNEGTRRFCDSCVKHVHDLSAMTEREAAQLLADNHGERVCVRYTCDATGKIKFKPEPAPVVPITALTRRTPRRSAGVKHAAAVALALAACTPHERDDVTPRPSIAVEAGDPKPQPEAVQPHVVDEPDPLEVEMGEVTPEVESVDDEPCDPEPAVEPRSVKMGKIAPRVVEPPPTPAEEIELMGDVAVGT